VIFNKIFQEVALNLRSFYINIIICGGAESKKPYLVAKIHAGHNFFAICEKWKIGLAMAFFVGYNIIRCAACRRKGARKVTVLPADSFRG